MRWCASRMASSWAMFATELFEFRRIPRRGGIESCRATSSARASAGGVGSPRDQLALVPYFWRNRSRRPPCPINFCLPL